MADETAPDRRGEYESRGEYHRHLDDTWDYRPTYLAKMAAVRRHLDGLPREARVLDAGCGEGVIVQEYAGRLRIEGVDANYRSDLVREGSVTALPYADGAFDDVLCLDVLEHLTFAEQPVAIGRAVPGPEARRRRARLGSQSGPPAVPRALPAAGTPDQDGELSPNTQATAPWWNTCSLRGPAGSRWSRAAGSSRPCRCWPRSCGGTRCRCNGCTPRSRDVLPVPGWGFLNLIWLRKPARA